MIALSLDPVFRKFVTMGQNLLCVRAGTTWDKTCGTGLGRSLNKSCRGEGRESSDDLHQDRLSPALFKWSCWNAGGCSPAPSWAAEGCLGGMGICRVL